MKKGSIQNYYFLCEKVRGLMAAYIVKNKISSVKQLCELDAQILTFKRSEQDLAHA
jgi:cytoplasmic iron level regulating protein YaaA (DUF328/UPF0246 family)